MLLTVITVSALFLILLLSLVILGMFIRAVVTRELKQKDQLIQDLRQDNLDLLNRLMAGDLQTFATMTALNNSQKSSTSDDPYYGQSDADVIGRLQGLGEVLYDDQTEEDPELAAVLGDFGYVAREPG